VASQAVQGESLFNNEPFLGNGRTCATCHVSSASFGLPPGNVRSRFQTVASTFDPLFIGETAPSSFDAGFDFNLNTLLLAAPVATNAPCTGELRGIITSGSGSTAGRAKVLARTSSTTYLIDGGKSPVLSGTVTDGTCAATVASVASGNLGAIAGSPVAGLEDPRRMRTGVGSSFPQGRALILENIDGFSNPAVFRKSAHLLNLSQTAPFGFSGNIADLQTFATAAVTQHFPRTLNRLGTGARPDFRLPSAVELAAMEAFLKAQEFPPGNDPNKFDLDRFVKTAAQARGRAAFFGNQAKCSFCHGGPVLATTTVSVQGKAIGINGTFNTGVVNQFLNGGAGSLPCEPSAASIGACGSREFNVPQLFNVKHLGPLFHDGSAATVREAVDFYSSSEFNASPAGRAIGGIFVSAGRFSSGLAGDITAFLEGLVVGSMAVNSSTALSGPPGAAVVPAPSVIVSNDDGNPASGVTVTFAVTGGGGSLTGATQVTSASGVATVGSWILGSGANTLTASASGLTGSPVTFSAAFTPTIAAIGNQTTNQDTPTGAIAVTVGDLDTAAASVTVSVSSSNPTLVPNANLVLGGGGANRTITVTPAANHAGTTTITLTVSDGSLTASTTFVLTVTGVQGAPAISAMANQTTNEDTSTPAQPFTIGDVDTAASNLTVSGSSSNTTLVPNANVAFGGSGANRTVRVTPSANQSGDATMTVTVSDGSHTATTAFGLTVTAVNDPPTIAAIANQTTNQDVATRSIAVAVGDVDTSVANLTMSRSSSNTTLVPNANVVFGGSGANRDVTVTPAANQSGDATITVTVGDGSLTASTVFLLTVTANKASDPAIWVDAPASGSTSGPNFTVSGWALDRGAGSGSGIDAVHVYAYPNPGSGTMPVFLGVATLGRSRSDIAVAFGNQFAPAGFTLAVSALPIGHYQIVAFGHSVVTKIFGAPATAMVTVTAPQPNPAMSLDGPANDSTVGRTVTVAGWALDRAAPSGTGVDAVVVWAYPKDGTPAQFIGTATYGLARPDIGVVFGSQFTNAGFSLSAPINPGMYTFVAFARSTVAGSFNMALAAQNVTVQATNTNAVLFVDTPSPNTTQAQPRPFTVSGWAVDSGADSGTGIDAVAVWAFPTSGAPPTLVGLANYGSSRTDIGTLFGDTRFTSSGFTFTVTSANLPAAGSYDLIVFGRSTVTGEFTVARVVRVDVQ